MSLEEAWNSNPNSVAKIIIKIREAKDPKSKKKESDWSRKELLQATREMTNV